MPEKAPPGGQACVVAGDARTGLVAADGALGLDGDVRTWASEARRRRAEFLAALGAPAGEVEAELRRALEVARGQGARLLELRAATSLLRHRLDAGDDRSPGRDRERLRAVLDTSPSWATPPTCARRPRSSPAAERGTLPGTFLERPAAHPLPIEERRPR